MTDKRLSILFYKYFDGSATEPEEVEFYTLASKKDNQVDLENLMEECWGHFVPTEQPFNLDARNRMLNAIHSHKTLRAVRYPNTMLWRILSAAAAIVIVIGVLFYTQFQKDQARDLSMDTATIVPGKSGATLTLSNGKKIQLGSLANGKIIDESGVVISKSTDGKLVYSVKENTADGIKMNTLSTARGETYQINLPDGSQVWLNAASSITYASNFSNQKVRKVIFEGEGYFEVKKDKSRPFIVESSGQQIEVLGTHFNLNTYPEEHEKKTTLLEGRVAVKLPGISQSTILNPGEQSVNSDNRILTREVDVEDVVAWKDGEFVFNGDDFRSMMLAIGRWYNVEISFDYMPKDAAVEMHFSKNRDLKEVLKRMESVGNIKFKIQGRRISVIK